jgi:hypothetical protein
VYRRFVWRRFVEETFCMCALQYAHNLASLILKGQSHEKVGEMSVWGISLGPN